MKRLTYALVGAGAVLATDTSTAITNCTTVDCGVGHTGISGTIVVSHLAVKCSNGRSLKLTCGTATGGRQKCNLNDHQICTDDTVRSAADFCAR